VAGAIAACVAGNAGAAAADELRDHRPVLAYDSAEDHFAQPVSERGEVIEQDLVYGRVVEQDEATYLAYWLFYAQNTQDRGILRTGRHEGDWEYVQLRLGPGGEPETATFAQHSTAEACPVDEIEVDGEAPVVYVANGSHASYPRAGTVDRQWPDPNDEADGGGRRARPPVERIDDAEPSWVDNDDPWGSSEAGWFPGEQSSPPGPRFQADGRWDDPAAFEAAARPCGSDPPRRAWQTPVLALLGGGVLLGGALFIRRRRRAP
jgi:LPXTG-motif cell wall-anchored protein